MDDHNEGNQDHQRKIIGAFDTGMLVTQLPDDSSRGRPMAIAKHGLASDSRHDKDGLKANVLYFVTNRNSPKVSEVIEDSRAVVTLQDSSHFVSLTGMVCVSEEKGLVARLWSAAWKIWFPEGQEDPNICVLTFSPHSAEYWDNSGTKGLHFLFDAVTAYVKGEKIKTGDADSNGRVRL